jgi:hypothetical protein
MGLLESLLPSVRGLRAPLSAGLLILLGVWLLADPPDPDHATGLYKRLVDLNAVVKVGLTAVAIFVASVIGAALSTMVAIVVNVVWRGGWSRPLHGWLCDALRSVEDGVDHGFGVPLRRPVPTFLVDRLHALGDVPARGHVFAFVDRDVR